MNCIKVIKDEDLGLTSKNFHNPTIRICARGIVLKKDGTIAIFNKSKKNEYKLPGGGVYNDEDIESAFKREILEETGCKVNIIEKLGTIEERKSLDNFIQISHIFVSKVETEGTELFLTQKEKEEGAKLLWVNLDEGLKLISECFDKLKASEYENLYHSKFIVYRDRIILEYYKENN